MENKIKTKTNGPKDLRKKRDSPPRRSLREILQQGAGSSRVPVRGPVATSEPAAISSAKGRDDPMVRNLPEVEPGTSLLGASGIDTPIQGASSTGIPAPQYRRIPSGKEGIVQMCQTKTEKKPKLSPVRQELGASSNQEMHARLSR
jgi:hypothetical protein